jgi:hypothetical protein
VRQSPKVRQSPRSPRKTRKVSYKKAHSTKKHRRSTQK